jgi:hypothetical protein
VAGTTSSGDDTHSTFMVHFTGPGAGAPRSKSRKFVLDPLSLKRKLAENAPGAKTTPGQARAAKTAIPHPTFVYRRFSRPVFMRSRPSIIIGEIAIMVALVALTLWLTKRPAKTTAGTPAPSDNVFTTSTPPVEGTAVAVPRKSREAQIPASPSAEGDAPIVFYGKLEDQAANPVAGAQITGTTIYHQGGTELTGRFLTASDADGSFKLDAGTGASLQLMPRKPGYALASTNIGGFYTRLKPEEQRQHPDPNNPVVIKMWKLQGAEPLASIDRKYQIHYTANSPLCFDFIAGAMVPSGGDIKISIIRPPGFVSPRNPQDWRVEVDGIEGAQGGLMDVTPGQWRTTYWAPADGYQPGIVYLMSDSPPQEWSGNLDAALFCQTRSGGVYTKLNLKIGINSDPDDPVTIELHGIANTNGSCNWEGDPNTFQWR